MLSLIHAGIKVNRVSKRGARKPQWYFIYIYIYIYCTVTKYSRHWLINWNLCIYSIVLILLQSKQGLQEPLDFDLVWFKWYPCRRIWLLFSHGDYKQMDQNCRFMKHKSLCLRYLWFLSWLYDILYSCKSYRLLACNLDFPTWNMRHNFHVRSKCPFCLQPLTVQVLLWCGEIP